MKKLPLVPALLPALIAANLAVAPAIAADSPRQFEPSHESLNAQYQDPQWLMDAKFGIYTHWGVVTHAIQDAERPMGWYGRHMYEDGHYIQKHHKKHWGDPAEVGYKDLIEGFTADNFDAKQWAELFAAAGAKFAGPVAVHHDNFLLWDSEISPYNSVEMGPKRDIAGELAEAIKGEEMYFFSSFHHGFAPRFFEFAHNYDGADAPDLYGEFVEPVRRGTPEFRWISRANQEIFLAKVDEYTAKYQPDMIYFDFGLGWHDWDIQHQMYANYYNEALGYGQSQPTVAQKKHEGHQLPYSMLDLERGRLSFMSEFPWLTDTSTGAWFNHKNPHLEKSSDLVNYLVDVVSKNGIMVLNVGPDHTGAIPAEQVTILEDIGAWLEINGEGIYDTRPWLTYGEGLSANDRGHYAAKDSKAHAPTVYRPEDIRYTQSKDGKTIYAFAMGWEPGQDIELKATAVDKKRWRAKAELLGLSEGNGEVSTRINDAGNLVLETAELNVDAIGPVYGFKLTGFDLSWHEHGHHYLPTTQTLTLEARDGETHLLSSNVRIRHTERHYNLVLDMPAHEGGVVQLHMLKGDKSFDRGFRVTLPAQSQPGPQEFGHMLLNDKGRYTLTVQSLIDGVDLADGTQASLVIDRADSTQKMGQHVD
ncbi:alpha-L-fucosidase [Ferrimonas pelagia]|uniref:alpha-L-fucosidase n=1 Tax=Ferrimonas pelagia TaxID=1177826 RepID=A0ABP9EBM6_9GAMM